MLEFSFHNKVEIFFGDGVRRKIGDKLHGDFTSVLVVMGKGINEKEYSNICSDLIRNEIKVYEIEPITSNPHLSAVRDGAIECKKNGVELVIALGGGSAMDCAKMIAASAMSEIDPAKFLWGEKVPIERSLPTVMVPTIAATGTELNNTAVIRDEVKKKKNSCASEAMYPKYTFIDPELAVDLPQKLIIWGAMDILSHTFEYYFNGYESIFQNNISEGIIRSVIDCIDQIMNEGFTTKVYGELMWTASVTWGTGLTKIGRGLPDMACHTIEEGIGAYYDTHHGAGLGIITPQWMRHIDKKAPKPFARFARNIFNVNDEDDVAAADQGINDFVQWIKRIGAPQSYSELNDSISKDTIRTISDEIFRENNGVVGRLIALNANDIFQILMNCL